VVVEIADQAAVEAGIELSRFDRPTVKFEFVEPNCTWSVLYDSRSGIIGSHFTVVVDDKTRHADLFGGM